MIIAVVLSLFWKSINVCDNDYYAIQFCLQFRAVRMQVYMTRKSIWEK